MCTCGCLYCLSVHVCPVCVVTCVHESPVCARVMVAGAAKSLTGWGSGGGQGRRKSHFLSVWPPTKLFLLIPNNPRA